MTEPDPLDPTTAAAPNLVEAPTVRVDPGRSRAQRIAGAVIPPLVLVAALVGVWYFISYRVLDARRRFLLRPLHEVVDVGFRDAANRNEIVRALWSSIKVAALGLSISIVVGVLIATLMSQSKLIERAMFPVLVAIQAVPILALTPLIGFWFDTGQTSRVIVCVIISFFPIVLNTLFGLVSAESGLHELLTLHHASRWTRLRTLMFPAALPALFAGLRISAGLSVIGAIVGDFFFGKGDVGIGQRIRQYHNDLAGEQLLAAIILSSLLGIAVFLGFGAIQALAVGKWYDSKSGGGR
jgi:NitT/TauT family transport system permease protein